jgi:hypothetical protein
MTTLRRVRREAQEDIDRLGSDGFRELCFGTKSDRHHAGLLLVATRRLQKSPDGKTLNAKFDDPLVKIYLEANPQDIP